MSPPPEPEPYAVRTRRWSLVVVLLLTFIAAAWVIWPLWMAIVIGAVVAISEYRLFLALSRKLRGRDAWAAGILTIATGIVVLVVGAFVVATIAEELIQLVGHLHQHKTGSLESVLGGKATRAIESLGVNTAELYAWVRQELAAAATAAASAAAVVVRTTGFALLGLVIALVSMYFTLVDGPALARRVARTLPLEPRHTEALFVEAREVGRIAFIGTLATAVIQGALGGIGYFALGVPQPIVWAVATAIASFIPVIGTLIVWIPIALYLLVAGHLIKAILLVVWGILVITSLADYVIRPRLVGSRHGSHPLLTLVALLGGIEVLGLPGLIIAPILVSLFVAAFRIYERDVQTGEVPGAERPLILDEPPAAEERAAEVRG